MRRFTMYLYALFYCLYVFTVGYLFRKNRHYVSNICEIFHYQRLKEFLRPELRRVIPAVEIAGVVRPDIAFQARELTWQDGAVSFLELIVIAKLVRQYRPKRIFEIGTFNGRTTLNMACNAPDDARVFTLDLPKRQTGATGLPILNADKSFIDQGTRGSSYLGTDCEGKIVQLYGDSATFDYSPFEQTMDLVFIDGSHAYEYVLNDSKRALALLRDGQGIIIWHDYSWVWDTVTKALNTLHREDGRFSRMRLIRGTSLVCLLRAQGPL